MLTDVILIFKNKDFARNVRKTTSFFSHQKNVSRRSILTIVRNLNLEKVVNFVKMVIIQLIMAKDVFPYL